MVNRLKIKNIFKELPGLRFSTKNILLMRFIVANFFIILFCVVILAAVSVNKINQVITSNTDNFSENQLHTVSDAVDTSLNDMFRTVRSMAISSDEGDIFNFNRWTHNDKSSIDFYNWKLFFKGYITNYDFIHSVWILNSNNVIIDSESSIASPDEYENWRFIADSVNKAKEEHQYLIPYTTTLHTIGNTQVVSMVAPLKSGDASYNGGAIILNIKARYFAQKLGYAQANSNYLSFIYNDESGEVTAASANNYNPAEIADIAAKSLKSENSTVYKIGKNKYTAYTARSSIVPKWHMVTMYNNSYATGQKQSIYIWYITVLILLILFCLVSTWFITFYIYKPLQRIITNLSVNINDMPDVSFKKKNDEIQIISSHISTLENELSDKNKFIQDNIEKIRGIAVRSILSGDSDEFSARDLAKCGIIFTEKYYYVALFTLDRYLDILSDNTEKNFSALSARVFSCIYNTLSQTINSTGIYWDHNRYAFILNTDKPLEASAVALFIGRVNETLNETCKCSVSLCLSAPVSSMGETATAFSQVIASGKHRFSIGNEALIICPASITYSIESSRAVSSCISSIAHNLFGGDTGHLLEKLNKFKALLSKASPDDVRINTLKLFDTIKKNFLPELASFDFNMVYKRIDNIISYSVYPELCEYITSKLMEMAALCAESGDKNISRRIKEYIDLYYYNDISLDSLSDCFHVSSSYVSKVFTEAYDVGFQSYLSQLRISKAMDMLKNTDLSIQKIGEKVGFMSYNSFSRTFKRITGVSAKEYRTNPSANNN